MNNDVSSDSVWWKLFLGAACLIAVVIIGAGFGVNAWFLGMVLVLLAATCALVGAVAGFATLLRRNRPARG